MYALQVFYLGLVVARKLLVFGNGLGMALDSNFFCLERAIKDTWSAPGSLPDDVKSLIRSCLPTGNDYPQGEADLDKLQLALSATDFLCGIKTDDCHWLSQHGQSFPVAVRRFLYETAMQFHINRTVRLPDQFSEALVNFLFATKSHVATLNYDDLLYGPLISAGVLSGFSGALVDGFTNSGFDESNFQRRFGRTFGYYIHLHGSPLFIDNDGRSYKLPRNQLNPFIQVVSSHIVLTHVEHKTAVISASNVLSAYWRCFYAALGESNEIIFFGYSGEDHHLNRLVELASKDKRIRVVEWEGSGHDDQYWRTLFPSTYIEVLRLDNILEFNDW